MGFTCHYQQRIALSAHAARIIEDDSFLFQCYDQKHQKPGYHKFINKIFCNSFDTAEASIHLRTAEKRDELCILQNSDRTKSVSSFIDRIIQSETTKLESKIDRLLSEDKYVNIVISLNKTTLNILESSEEDSFYKDRASLYIRAVLEEYAQLDSMKRKMIYYRETIERLQKHIEKHDMIEISYYDNTKKYKMIPVQIEPDIYRTHLYLAGVTAQEHSKFPYVSGRIDRIASIQYIRTGKVADASRSALKKIIEKNGVQYLKSSHTEIRIQLSPEGVKKYNQLTFQRPAYTHIEDPEKNIYLFDITPYQAMVYFFKFGSDAIVLEPEHLRNRFCNMYRAAFEKYQ